MWEEDIDTWRRRRYRELYNTISIPESPEANLAKKDPEGLLDYYKKKLKEDSYNESLKTGKEVANTYLLKSSQENVDRIQEIYIEPQRKKWSGLTKRTGLAITFQKRKK